MPDYTVKQERTGWRDEWISNRHRCWGWDAPFVDLDWIGIEYDMAKPVVLVEYKAKGATIPNLNHPSYRALKVMADMCKLPFAIVFYHPVRMLFWIIAGNEAARQALPCRKVLSEYEYVEVLYHLRNRNLPDNIAKALNRSKDNQTSAAHD